MLLRNQLMAHRVEAQIEVEPDLPMPDIDPNQIQQVFVNLINNAVSGDRQHRPARHASSSARAAGSTAWPST